MSKLTWLLRRSLLPTMLWTASSCGDSNAGGSTLDATVDAAPTGQRDAKAEVERAEDASSPPASGDAGSDAEVAAAPVAMLVEIAANGDISCELGCTSIGKTCAATCPGPDPSGLGLAPQVAGVAWYPVRAGQVLGEVPEPLSDCAYTAAAFSSGLRTSLECCCEGSATPPPQDCSAKTNCEECQACAVDAACLDANIACASNFECNAFQACVSACTTGSCIDQCTLASPNGYFLFYELSDCLCAACSSACAGETGGCTVAP